MTAPEYEPAASLEFRRLSVETLHDFLDYFDHKAFTDNPNWAGCYCQFYLNSPDENQAATTESKRQSACDRIATGNMEGYLAYLQGEVVGWIAAGASRLFPGLPDAQDSLARILCFVIHPQHRGQGIAKTLLGHAIADLKSRGFSAVEAAPYTQEHQQAANYRGHLSMYESFGFEFVADMGEFGTLVRKHLD